MSSTGRRFDRTLVELLYEDIVPRLKVQDVYAGVDFIAKGHRFLRGGCPLHGGRDANFSVNLQTLSWTCFSHCGHGSVVSYMNGGVPARGERFTEIVADLARMAGVEIEWKRTPDSPEVRARLRRREILEGLAVLAQRLINGPSAERAITYLVARGFPSDPRELSQLGLGYLPTDVNLSEAINATPAELGSNGLDDTRWRSRIVIPWRDRTGRISTFLGRSIDPAADIRYLYLRGATIPPFFGFDRVERSKPASVLVVESPLDAMLLWHHGVDHVIAIGGSIAQERHVEVLKESGVRTVIVALDADRPGRAATSRLLDVLASGAPEIRVQVVSPDGYVDAKDPGEFIVEYGPDAMLALIDAREPAALYRSNDALWGIEAHSPVAVRRDALAKLVEIARGLSGPERLADLEDIVMGAERRLGYSEAAIRGAFGVPRPPGGNEDAKPIRRRSGSTSIAADHLVDILTDIGKPISITMLAHLVRGNAGPATANLVNSHQPRHVGALAHLGFLDARDQVQNAITGDSRILVVDRRVSLREVSDTSRSSRLTKRAESP